MERIKKALEKARTHALTQRGEATPSVQNLSADGLTRGGLCRSPVSIPTVIPDTLERHRIVAGNRGAATSAFDMLRTQVLRDMSREKLRILGVTSPGPRCGRTTVSICLAHSLARQTPRTVMLVDFDLGHGQIGEYLGITETSSLSDYLEGHIGVEATVVDIGIPRLRVIPNVKRYDNVSEMLNKPAALSLVQRLKRDADIDVAVLDLPPVLTSDAVLAFLPQIDCLLLVVGDGVSTRVELEEAQRQLQNSNMLGVILNTPA